MRSGLPTPRSGGVVIRQTVVDAALRASALALAAWTLAAGTWAMLDATVLAAPRPAPAAPAAAVLPRAEAFARGGASLGADAVLRVGAATPPDPTPAPEPSATPAGPLAVDTPEGRLVYVRALPVLATYYTPASAGRAASSPWYGITATGARATRGIVAVDPRVIPLYSWLYVPGYGVAQARDTGGSIIGDHIDVAFDDGDGAWWGRRLVTVYVLAPGSSGR